jgi:AMMECR1 domain-containing protein
MSNSKTPTIAISAGLFKKNISVSHTVDAFSEIPDKTFGAFVSVKRGRPLSKWPEDIHGCIGYWDPNYNVMNRSNLMKEIQSIARSATYSDDRRAHFKDPIEIDILTKYEVIFMVQPIMKIDQNGMIVELNERFDNMKYGLIAQNGSNRATYLPEVFKDTPWNEIRDKLIRKAGNPDNAKFHAYRGIPIHQSLRSYFVDPVIEFFENNYQSVPYGVSRSGNVSYDAAQYVRNAATIRDILSLEKDGSALSSNMKQKMRVELNRYVQIFHLDPKEARQALPFVATSLKMLNDDSDTVRQIAEYLIEEIDDLEPRFEYGEVLSGLAELIDLMERTSGSDLDGLDLEQILASQYDRMYEECIKWGNRLENDDIFQLNWYAQALTSAYRNRIDYPNYQRNALILAKAILSVSKGFSKSTESNYIVVTFEALCGLLCILSNNESIKNKTVELMSVLESRMNDSGLIGFIRGDARVDITGHFLNGIHNLMSYHKILTTYNKDITDMEGGGLIKSYYDRYLENRKAYRIVLKMNQIGGGTLNIKVNYELPNKIIDYYVEKNIDIADFKDIIRENLHKKGIERTEEDRQIRATKPLDIFNFHIIKIEFDSPISDDSNLSASPDSNTVIDSQYLIDGILYIHFYNLESTNEISFGIDFKKESDNQKIKKVGVFTSAYKNGDSYVLGPVKPFQHIYQVIQQQYHNRIQVDNQISTIRLNELTSEKLDYYQYMIDKGLIPAKNTRVIKRNVSEEYEEIPSEDMKENVVKYSFYSTSKCVFIPGQSDRGLDICHKEHGYIVQKVNRTLHDFEFKTHVIHGKEMYTMVRFKLGDYFFSRDAESKHEPVDTIVKKYADQVPGILEKVFDAMNRLRYIKEVRNGHEMRRVYRLVKALVEPHQVDDTSFLDEYVEKRWNRELDNLHQNNNLPKYVRDFLKPFKKGEYVCYFDAMFTSLLASFKLDRLLALQEAFKLKEVEGDSDLITMVDKLIHLYRMSDSEFDNIHLQGVDHPIKDYYMRIDLALPDDGDYLECYLNEVEPLASGKGEYPKLLDGFGEDWIDASPTSNILINAYRIAIEKGYINFEDATYKI